MLRALFRQLPHIRFELVVLVLDRVQEEAFQQVHAALLLVHLIDQVVDLAHHVLERSLQLAPGGHLAVERLHDGEQIAVERDLGAGGRLDRAHGYAPKLLMADGSSGWISRKFCAPVIVSIVSTRFCTPASLSAPPTAWAWRYKSIRQPIVALST